MTAASISHSPSGYWCAKQWIYIFDNDKGFWKRIQPLGHSGWLAAIQVRYEPPPCLGRELLLKIRSRQIKTVVLIILDDSLLAQSSYATKRKIKQVQKPGPQKNLEKLIVLGC